MHNRTLHSVRPLEDWQMIDRWSLQIFPVPPLLRRRNRQTDRKFIHFRASASFVSKNTKKKLLALRESNGFLLFLIIFECCHARCRYRLRCGCVWHSVACWSAALISRCCLNEKWRSLHGSIHKFWWSGDPSLRFTKWFNDLWQCSTDCAIMQCNALGLQTRSIVH